MFDWQDLHNLLWQLCFDITTEIKMRDAVVFIDLTVQMFTVMRSSSSSVTEVNHVACVHENVKDQSSCQSVVDEEVKPSDEGLRDVVTQVRTALVQDETVDLHFSP